MKVLLYIICSFITFFFLFKTFKNIIRLNRNYEYPRIQYLFMLEVWILFFGTIFSFITIPSILLWNLLNFILDRYKKYNQNNN